MSVNNYDLNDNTTNINNDVHHNDNIINNIKTTLSLVNTNNSNPC